MMRGAETGPCLEVAFDSDEVALEVEEDGVTLDNGWSLVPLVLPIYISEKMDQLCFCAYYIVLK